VVWNPGLVHAWQTRPWGYTWISWRPDRCARTPRGRERLAPLFPQPYIACSLSKNATRTQTLLTKPTSIKAIEPIDPMFRQIRDLVYKVAGIFQLEEKLYLDVWMGVCAG